MDSYIVRLTTEGESVEELVLADDCLHAARQALGQWHRLAPDETAVLSMRRLDTEAKRQQRVDHLAAEQQPAEVVPLHAFQRAAGAGSPPAPAPAPGDVLVIVGAGQLVYEH